VCFFFQIFSFGFIMLKLKFFLIQNVANASATVRLQLVLNREKCRMLVFGSLLPWNRQAIKKRKKEANSKTVTGQRIQESGEKGREETAFHDVHGVLGLTR
jgi:hypothetical protein